MDRLAALAVISVVVLLAACGGRRAAPAAATADGYYGAWYADGKFYSGGFALFPAQHTPFAVHRPEAGKTFFVYGGAIPGRPGLKAMAAWYDHRRDLVPRPTIVHDWGADGDTHRNPTISVDGEGRVWVFVSGHGDTGYIYRGTTPYSVAAFERIAAPAMTYPQPWRVPGKGFFLFFTSYARSREQFWLGSPDGLSWADPESWKAAGQLNTWAVGGGYGNYQISGQSGKRIGTALNVYVDGQNRSNLYYLQTDDAGQTWQLADGTAFTPPYAELAGPPLVRDFWSEKLLVYLQDLAFDRLGRPAILFLTAPAGQYLEGPGGPRTWTVARWTGGGWSFSRVTESLNNFDCGSLYIEDDGTWRIIGPTEPGPQRWKTGGEVAVWTSRDEGETWTRARLLTRGSPYNHSYVRRPVDADPGFYALWADGDGNRPSDSRLYFCTKDGAVRVLPRRMSGETAAPERRPLPE